MDIYEFFNSNDVAEYSKKIGHKYSPLDMAVIISLSKSKTIREKCAAWQEIIDSTLLT